MCEQRRKPENRSGGYFQGEKTVPGLSGSAVGMVVMMAMAMTVAMIVAVVMVMSMFVRVVMV